MAKHVANDCIVIGVSGVTCGGKTTLANKLKEALAPVYIFHQDHYFYPDDSPHHVKCEGLAEDHNNYDVLSSLDMEAMYSDILKTVGGEDRSHASHVARGEGKYEMKGKRFIVVEGFTVLNYKPIMELCDLRYYLVLGRVECFSRRGAREYSPPDVAGYFEACVWPQHLRYRAEIEKDERVTILDGTEDAFPAVERALVALGAARAFR